MALAAKRTLLLAAAIASLAAGCATHPECTRLPGGGGYCLQPTTDTPPFNLLQRTTLSFGERRETLLARIESDAAGLRFVALTPMGQTLFRLLWDNRNIVADLPPALAGRMEPALLPALVQIANWPAAAVRAGLQAGSRLAEQDGGREVRVGDDAVLLTECLGGIPCRRLHLSAPAAGFVLDADTVPEAAAE